MLSDLKQKKNIVWKFQMTALANLLSTTVAKTMVKEN